MRYKDLDGISKFQMDFFRNLMLKIELYSEDFVSINELAEKSIRVLFLKIKSDMRKKMA